MHYKRKGHRGRSKKQGRIGANACRDAGNSASKGLFSWTYGSRRGRAVGRTSQSQRSLIDPMEEE